MTKRETKYIFNKNKRIIDRKAKLKLKFAILKNRDVGVFIDMKNI